MCGVVKALDFSLSVLAVVLSHRLTPSLLHFFGVREMVKECASRGSKATCEEQGAFELNDGDVRIFEENSTGARESEQSEFDVEFKHSMF